MGLKFPMAYVAIFDLDRFSPGDRFRIGDGKVLHDVESRIALSLFFDGAVGPFQVI